MRPASPLLIGALVVFTVLVAALVPDDVSAQEELSVAGLAPSAPHVPLAYNEFDELFSHVRTIDVEGSAEHPIYRLTSMAVRDTLVAIVDQSAHTLTVLGESGEIHFQVGGEGAEQGELSNPDWVGFDADGRVVVKEWHANHRVQLFAAEDGAPVNMFSLEHGSTPTGQAYIEGTTEEQRILFVTSVPCTEDEAAYCVIQEQAFTGEILRRFGPMEEIEPEYEGQPFVMGRDGEGRSYVAHRYGGTVTVYNAEGIRIDAFSIDGAPEVELLDLEAVSEANGEASTLMQQQEFTMIRSIHAVRDHLVVTHYRDYATPHYFVTVFDRTGEVLASGIEVDHPLQSALSDRFYFVEEDLDADHGAYVIHEYQYTPQPLD